MNRYIMLENIANGIHAANRIRQLQKSSTRSSDSDSPIDNIALISEIIQSIARYSPGNSRAPLSQTGNLCREYCNTYKNFKHFLRSSRSRGTNKEQFVNSLRILEPIMDNKKKAAISKIMKIYELFS